MKDSGFDIIAEGVTKSFGNVQALRGVDLKVKIGEFLTVFGPNGAGKTTLIKLLATLTKPTSGNVTIANHDIKVEPDKVRAVLGVISHDPYLYENLSAIENIRFFASLYGISAVEERSIQVIKRVGLEGRMHDLVRTFSRGMKQRLAVARAVIHEPKILLLDEPYTGLDQHGSRIFTEMLGWLKAENRTVVMTTHDIAEGLEISNSVAILSGGKIAYQSDTDGVELSRFKEIYFEKVGNRT
ncbi:MAG TPA: heme ABC exporter ATP-binding protein CcmA [Thermodesulfobacteriota bacterium]|nr:heme ABC exporter ATP-binding protein CcmA [Thermodesulfobacteriota bacterium]